MCRRHSLVWLTPDGWQNLRVADAHRRVAEEWRQGDWPLIVRRRDADAAADEMCLGIAAPPDAQGDKLRIAARVHRNDVRDMHPPLALAAAIPHAGVWRTALEHLQQEAERYGLTLRVYGSLAMQALTGQHYLRPSSDIDLLLRPRDCHELTQMLALVERHRQTLPLDGEIEFPDGTAVAWKEWLTATTGGQRVLVKRLDSVALLRTDELLATLETRACPA